MPSTSPKSETGKLQPDISKLAEAFKVLSDELPRFSNIDAFAILDVLQAVRTDIQSSMAAQEELGKQLDRKLTAIQDTLISLEHRVVGLESSLQSSAYVQRAVGDTSMPVKIQHEKSTRSIDLELVDSDEKSAPELLPQAETLIRYQKQGIFKGPSGALIIIIVSFIPIVFALWRPDIFDAKPTWSSPS